MVVCKFFLRGDCRYGDNCRNEHPRSGGGGGGGGGGFGNNRFGALSNNTGNRFGGGGGGGNDAQKSNGYKIDAAAVRLELGDERPRWILSSYGAAKNTPASLFEDNEYSAEEIRLRFYELQNKGQEAQADQEAGQLWNKADQDMKNVLAHANEVEKFMQESERKHPNRYDFLEADGTKSKEEVARAAETTQSSGFGVANSLSQPSTSNSFGKPAAATFGQAAAPSAFSTSPFGKPAQPSAFGQPAFGQAVSAPASSGSAFGQAASGGAFGQPASTSAFGKPAFGSSGFGQQAPSTTAFGQQNQNTAFGATPSSFGQQPQNSPFGQQPQSVPAFGQSQPAASAFGRPSQPGFGQSAFGQPSQPSAAFGQSAFGQPGQPATSSPFGQAQQSSPFGNKGTTTSNPFGQGTQQSGSPFGAPRQASVAPEVSMEGEPQNPFSQPSSQSNPFNTPTAARTESTSQPAAFSAPQAVVTNNNTSQTPHPLTNNPPAPLHYTQTLPSIPPQTNMSKQLTQYRGQPVQYLDDGTTPCYNRPDRRGPEKIWFPEAGAAQEVVALNREDKVGDLQAPAEFYTDSVKSAYKFLAETGNFEPGNMPTVPPMREWTVYDF